MLRRPRLRHLTRSTLANTSSVAITMASRAIRRYTSSRRRPRRSASSIRRRWLPLCMARRFRPRTIPACCSMCLSIRTATWTGRASSSRSSTASNRLSPRFPPSAPQSRPSTKCVHWPAESGSSWIKQRRRRRRPSGYQVRERHLNDRSASVRGMAAPGGTATFLIGRVRPVADRRALEKRTFVASLNGRERTLAVDCARRSTTNQRNERLGSRGRDCSSVNYILGAGDRACPRGDEETNEVRDFTGGTWAPKRYAAERIHDDLLRAFHVDAVSPGDLCDEADCAGGLDPARRDTHYAHPVGADFLGQALAVVRQGGLGRRVSDGGL